MSSTYEYTKYRSFRHFDVDEYLRDLKGYPLTPVTSIIRDKFGILTHKGNSILTTNSCGLVLALESLEK